MTNLELLKSKRTAFTFNGWSDEEPESVLRDWHGLVKPVLLGLPCAGCRAYYDAQLKACPICGHPERVSPTACELAVHPKARAA